MACGGLCLCWAHDEDQGWRLRTAQQPEGCLHAAMMDTCCSLLLTYGVGLGRGYPGIVYMRSTVLAVNVAKTHRSRHNCSKIDI